MASKKSRFFVFLSLFVLIFLGLFSVALTQGSKFLLSGHLVPPNSWMGWNSWRVEFFSSGIATEEQFNAFFNQNGEIYGNIWLGSSGWATFSHNVDTQKPKIQCPTDIIDTTVKDKTVVCPVVGAIWSESAGWILLNKDNIKTGSGVYYNPNTANIEWFGWSEMLGWIPVFSGVKFDDRDVTNNIVGSGSTNATNWYTEPDAAVWATVNFIGKVAVIGNIAGTKIFKVVNQNNYNNQNLGISYNTIQHASILNDVRKNVAQLTRNINISPTTLYKNIIYNTQNDYCITPTNIVTPCLGYNNFTHLDFESINPNDTYKNAKTIIIKWHDVIIDMDFNASQNNNSMPEMDKMKTIIALKDDAGRGGNVYITKNVGKIFAYIVAEGSVFSGEKNSSGTKIYVNDGEFKIPQKQLYINGLIISKNTIGWTAISQCPVMTDCSATNMKNYDMSYFRTHNPNINASVSIPEFRDNLAEKIKNTTVIIDYNNAIINNPPPGLETFRP